MNFDNGNFSASVPANATGGGWTSANIGAPFGGWLNAGGNPGGNFRLNDNGTPSSDPTILQQVTDLTIGCLYTLSWDYALDPAGSSQVKSFGVFLDSQSFGSALFIGENLLTSFVSKSVNFSATATAHTFIFAAELDNRTNGTATATDTSYFLDNANLSCAPTAVPEPASASLFALGLAGLVVIHRCRSTRAKPQVE